MTLTVDQLREVLHYDPVSGNFTWLRRPSYRQEWNTRYAGVIAGGPTKTNDGKIYWIISVNGQPIYAHRLAWLYMTGEWPAALVDHPDTVGLNKRWINLREANNSQNAANSKLNKNNTSGFKGVCLNKETGRFQSYITIENRMHHLGYHDTAEAAHAAYMQAAIALHGDFARGI